MNLDSRLERINTAIAEGLNKPFNGYLSEAVAIGNKLMACQRILNDDLFIVTDDIRLKTAKQLKAEEPKQ